MKEAAPRTIKLEDYQPPAYLIDDVDLCFDLQARGTRVTARLAIRRNPEGAGGPLRLDGEGLEPLERTWRAFTGERASFSEIVEAAKQRVIDTMLASEFTGRGKVEISRFKGLGEMPPAQLRDVPQAIFSQNSRAAIQIALEAAGLAGHFKLVVG